MKWLYVYDHICKYQWSETLQGIKASRWVVPTLLRVLAQLVAGLLSTSGLSLACAQTWIPTSADTVALRSLAQASCWCLCSATLAGHRFEETRPFFAFFCSNQWSLCPMTVGYVQPSVYCSIVQHGALGPKLYMAFKLTKMWLKAPLRIHIFGPQNGLEQQQIISLAQNHQHLSREKWVIRLHLPTRGSSSSSPPSTHRTPGALRARCRLRLPGAVLRAAGTIASVGRAGHHATPKRPQQESARNINICQISRSFYWEIKCVFANSSNV